jgi:CRISPR-associated protein Csd1
MFLEKLSEYAEQIDMPPSMYQLTPVRYVIRLDADGNYLNIEEHMGEKNKPTLSPIAPSCKRSSGVKPKLLVDNGEYTLGIGREKSDPRRVHEQHTAYVTQVCECAVTTREPSVIAVAHFLRTLDVAPITRAKPDFDPSANITFHIQGNDCYPFQHDSVKRYWATKAAASDEGGPVMQCLVCGEMRPPVERLPIVIKGIPGGQATGLTLISGNAAAFESYGLIASLIAPTCEACGERFGNALNALLREKKTHIVIPPLAYVFWLRDPGAATLDMPDLMDAEPAQVKNLLQAARRGRVESTLIEDTTAFYAATLSASGARVVLRDWIETSVERARQNLARYFTLQQILDYQGNPSHFSLYSLINATINRDTQEKPQAYVGQALMHVALHGGELPMSLLHRVVQRIRASRKVFPEQAALIKMVLLSQRDTTILNNERDDYMTTVSEDEKDAAYLCGRLLAQLDYIQHRALGKVNATIVDRFYGTASVSPAVVFPRLLKGAIPHLASLRPDHNANSKSYSASLSYPDKELARLLEHLGSFPPMLTLKEQGRFALGFYHQKAQILAQAAKTVNGQPASSEDTASDMATTVVNEGE